MNSEPIWAIALFVESSGAGLDHPMQSIHGFAEAKCRAFTPCPIELLVAEFLEQHVLASYSRS